jgi:hypothetical protein
MSIVIRVLVAALALGTCACRTTAAETVLRECPNLAKTFFAKPTRQTIAEFTSHDLEMQYTIYLCGNQYMHPPTLHLAVPFASGGEKSALFLRQKLAGKTDDLTTHDIVRVFVEMQRQRTYAVKGDASLMVLLREKVQAIRDPYWKGNAESMLAKLDQL